MRLPFRDDVFAASVVVASAGVLAIISKAGRNERARAPQVTRAARDLLNQAMTWAEMAQQDQEAVFKFQHVTLAMAYCNAARVLSADDELMRASNIDVHSKLRELESAQRKLIARIGKGSTGATNRGAAKGTPISGGGTWM